MAKKRTKKQKQAAKHTFTVSWNPSSSEARFQHRVKGQFENEAKEKLSKPDTNKYSINSARTEETVKIRKNIIKSLILAGIILALEIVLYFFWK